MATYAELAAIHQDAAWSAFSEKVRVAVFVRADAIRLDGAATAARKAWAIRATCEPAKVMEEIRAMIVAANKSATVTQILTASDAAIQTAVDAAANFFADNGG